MITAEEIIKLFGMKPLKKEGGFYVETYRAKDKISQAHLPDGLPGERNLATAILYLLTPETLSRLHRLRSDEIYHFCLGDAVTMLQLRPDGSSEVVELGRDVKKGQSLQVAVPANSRQGASLKQGGSFALMGATVVPGFEFDDFELAETDKLLQQYPDRCDLILKLTQQQ